VAFSKSYVTTELFRAVVCTLQVTLGEWCFSPLLLSICTCGSDCFGGSGMAEKITPRMPAGGCKFVSFI
jgi:hypothetical protein